MKRNQPYLAAIIFFDIHKHYLYNFCVQQEILELYWRL